MRLNGWSIAKSPAGVSLRPLTNGYPDTPEVCIDIIDGMLDISVHADGKEHAVARVLVPVEAVRTVEEA
jgi:hypothetical protein